MGSGSGGARQAGGRGKFHLFIKNKGCGASHSVDLPGKGVSPGVGRVCAGGAKRLGPSGQ